MEKIPQVQVSQRLRTENIWWDDPYQIPARYQGHGPRPYLKIFYPFVVNKAVQRAVVLMGPRRVGKTVLLHHVIGKLIESGISSRKICYVSVDHPLYNSLDLELFLEAFQSATGTDYTKEECFFFFDEIQYLKNWESYLKLLVDKYEHIKFVVSGSSAAALRLKSLESGAGRFTNFLLPPLTFYEYLNLLKIDGLVSVSNPSEEGESEATTSDIHALNRHFINYLNFGGYPEVALSPEIQKDPGQFVKSDIIDKVLLRDLPSLYGVHDIQELNRLFTSLAYNTACEVSLEALSMDSGVAKNTIKRYIEYLEAAFLIKTVHRVDRTARRFMRANFFKVYLTNPSMRAALFNLTGEGDSSVGRLVETAIFSQWFHSEIPLHYARWPQGEVDIVALNENHKARWVIEVKWTDSTLDDLAELKNVAQFCREQKLKSALVTSKTVKSNKNYQGIDLIFTPASLYCYELGHNLIRGRVLSAK